MYCTTLNLSKDQLEYLKNKKISDATLLELCVVLDSLLSENYHFKAEDKDSSSIVKVSAFINNYYFASIAGYSHYKARAEKGLARYARKFFPELNSNGYVSWVDLSKISESELMKIDGLGLGTFRVIVSMINLSGYELLP